MDKITNIFHKDNFNLIEFYSSNLITQSTNRLSVDIISESEAVISVNMIGNKVPTYVEASFHLPNKVTGDLTIIASHIGEPSLSCIELYSKPREIGRDIKVYMGKFSVTMPLKEDDVINFKFTEYSNFNRAGKIHLKCI